MTSRAWTIVGTALPQRRLDRYLHDPAVAASA